MPSSYVIPDNLKALATSENDSGGTESTTKQSSRRAAKKKARKTAKLDAKMAQLHLKYPTLPKDAKWPEGFECSDVSTDSDDSLSESDSENPTEAKPATAAASKSSSNEVRDSKKEASGRLPSFGEPKSKLENAPLVVLRPHTRDNAGADRPCYKSERAMIVIYDASGHQTHLPHFVKQQCLGPEVDFSIMHAMVNPQIELRFSVIRDMDIISTVKVRIPLHQVMHDQIRIAYASNLTSEVQQLNKYAQLVLRLRVHRAITHGLAPLFESPRNTNRRRLTKHELALLDPLRLFENFSHDGIRLEIRLRPKSKKYDSGKGSMQLDDDLTKLHDDIQKPMPVFAASVKDANVASLSYPTYRHQSGQPAVQVGQFLSRANVLCAETHPGLQLDAISHYVDREEAMIRLGYGAHLKFEEEKQALAAVGKEKHSLTLRPVGPTVLALITFSKKPTVGSAKERLSLRESTTVVLTIYNPDYDEGSRVMNAAGVVIANTFGLPPSNALILITDKTVKDFPISAGNTGLPQKSLSCQITAEVNQTTLMTEVDAVVKAYGSTEDAGKFLAKWPALLNHGSLSLLKDFDPVAEAKVPYQKMRDALAAFFKRVPTWNASQKRVIQKLESMPGRILLVNGVSGAGKTTLLVHMARYFLDLDFKIIIVGARNDAIDVICNIYEETHKDSDKILRVLPARREPFHKLDPKGPRSSPLEESPSSTEMSKSDTLMHELIMTVHLAKRANLKRSQLLTVQQAVLDLLKTKTVVQAQFTDGSDASDALDMMEYLRKAINKLSTTDPDLNDKEAWPEDEVKKLKQAYMYARSKVLADAPLVACTPVVSAEPDFRQYWNAGSSSKPVIAIYDEASCMSEAEALAPISTTQLDYGAHISGLVMFGDIKQLGPSAIGGTQSGHAVNEFLPQVGKSLMARLIETGHPYQTLDVQKRTASVLFEPANALFYDMQITTHNGPEAALTEKEAGLMAKVARYPDNIVLSDDQQRMLYVNINGAEMHYSLSSHSRANPVHVSFIIKSLPFIRDVYGDTVNENVAIFTPYNKQVALYVNAMHQLRAQGSWTAGQLPSVMTIDRAAGHEFTLSIVDTVVKDREAFLSDAGRVCVMFTRAKKMQLILSGQFNDVRSKPYTKTFVLPDNREVTRNIKAPLLYYRDYYFGHNAYVELDAKDYPMGIRL